MKTCIYRFTGTCRDCKRDYDPTHYPNNEECPHYCEVNARFFVVKEKIPRRLSEFEERVARWESLKKKSKGE
tara:strand:- start:195 stop:410 length:216 start_codon:yes stop_codon:yes gene_type:complete